MTAAHIALGFLAAFALASIPAVVEQIADWRADRRADRRTPPDLVDLRAVHADDQLLDRIGTGEPPWFDDEPTTVALKTWRDEIERSLDDHVSQWRRALRPGQQ